MKSTKQLFIYLGLSILEYECLANYISNLVFCNFLNLTIPYKFLGFFSTNFVTTTCVYGGAVNLVCRLCSSLFGFNTDCYGFLNDMYYHLSILSPCRVLIVGAGGAFSNIISVILTLKRFSIYLYNRTLAKYSVSLLRCFSIQLYTWGVFVNVIINTIPCISFYNLLLVNPILVSSRSYVYDITYGCCNPLAYLFGFYFFGFGMLYKQACENFKVYNERFGFKVS
ncbi:hypothetical protein JSR02_00645 [Candidatus Vidania fulgoroideae]|uniref:Uncharacterized protein n=1 Tax=Candidatus Vidania fulgoroideorum TaxID=881286 RepID=A0A975AEC5_9PROT|nr:hypothetical protein JSR02_00645 [Candidatus Vidania fulgoroideae]